MVNSSQMRDEIKNLIEKEQYNEASDLFLNMIEELKKEHSPLLAEYCYQYANFLFELQEYNLSLFMFQTSHELDYMRDEIEAFLYDAFVLPNTKEFKDTYEQHLDQYSDSIITTILPSFEELPIDFIPFDDNKYMMFNHELKVFEGLIDISEDSLNIFEKIDFNDEFSDIVATDGWNIASLKNCIQSYRDRNLYYISTDIKLTLSFLKIPMIMERLCPNLKIFDCLSGFQSYFHINTSVYLPRLYYGKNTINNDNALGKVITEEHKYRLTPEGRNTSNILLTIGIPSYNRGHRALQCIRNLLQLQYDAEIEFVVSNNGSIEHTEEYDEIAAMEDSRIHYFKFPNNVGANTNFCQVIDISLGRYTCLLSDEDAINLSAITHYLHVLKSNPNISFATSSGLNYYKRKSNQTFHKGSEAFLQSYLTTNYVSGLIYRSDLFHSLNIYQWTLDNIETNLGVKYYSHSCWVMFYTLYGDYYEDSMLLFMEGQAENDQKTVTITDSQSSKAFLPYGTLESRIEQHNGFINVLNQIKSQIDKETYLTTYLLLCEKTIFLISLVKKRYIETGITWDSICKDVLVCCFNGIAELNIPLSKSKRDILISKIGDIVLRY